MSQFGVFNMNAADQPSLETTVWHEHPVWSSNFFIVAALETSHEKQWHEQFWVNRRAERLFEIRCIPFFTYGLALGDVVETDEQYRFLRVVEKCGHRNLRIAIINQITETHALIADWVLKTGLLNEWHKPTYVAMDCPPELDVLPLVSFLLPHQVGGNLHFELDDGTLQ
jgi:hypothetical protein